MSEKKYVAIFDSGLGGLSVLKHSLTVLKNENIIYFGDSINAPYGVRTVENINELTDSIVTRLKKYKLKEAIIACNTISTNLLPWFKEKHKDLNFVLTRPAFEQAVKESDGKTKKKVLIIATTASCNSKFVKEEIEQYKDILDVKALPADPIVKFVEGFKEDSEEIREYFRGLFKDYMDIDYIVLGCTHFPFAKKAILDILGTKVKVIDNTLVSAEKAKAYLEEKGDLNASNDDREIIIVNTALNDQVKENHLKLLGIKESDYNIRFVKDL